MLPKKFSENVRKKLPEKVPIRGPGAHSDNWEVQLSTSSNTTSFVGEGWKLFVNAYSLQEKDILIFKYKNNTYFKVSVFDGQSCWVEKESSYFVKKSVSGANDIERKQEKNSPHVFSARNKDEKEKRSENVTEEREEQILKTRDPFKTSSKAFVEDSDDESDSTGRRKTEDPEWRPAKKFREEEVCAIRTPAQSARGGRRVHPETIRGNIFEPLSLPKSRSGRPGSKCTCGLLDPLTEAEEKERAKQRAAPHELTEESFSRVMSCSVIHRTYRLGLPRRWIDRFMPRCHQNVLLRLSGQVNKQWQARYNFDHKRCNGALFTGWKQFVDDNSLSIFDVCVFKPVGRNEGNVCLDVKIIRAVEEKVVQASNGLTSDRANSNGPLVMGLASDRL